MTLPPGCGAPICGAPIGCQARNCKLRGATSPAEAAELAHQARRQAIADAAIRKHGLATLAESVAASIELRRLITGHEEEAAGARHYLAAPAAAASPVSSPPAVAPAPPPTPRPARPKPASPQGSLL